MQLIKNHAYIHGFEDYRIIALGDSCFTPNAWGFYTPYSFDHSSGSYITTKNLPVRVYNEVHPIYGWVFNVRFEPELVSNHKEILDTAKKVFTHPTCKLSRSMMAEKYKKSLNPFLSDAVIIPKPDYNEFHLYKQALFINEQAKVIVMIRIESDSVIASIQKAQEGNKMKELISCSPDTNVSRYYSYDINDMLNAEFFYYGDVLFVPNSHSWAMDILTYNIPADKVVFEESVQQSLSNETNQLDFDSLCSIKDMLESSDENTVSAGLKSLSMMDWMHYPQSIKFILSNTNNKWNWVYNKACSSTSVKYMMNTITGAKKRSRWPGDFNEEIYEKDFELFKKLKCHYHHIKPDEIMNSIRSINFMRLNSEGFMSPNFKFDN